MINITKPEKPGDIPSHYIAKNDEDFIFMVLESILRDAVNLLTAYRDADYTKDVNTLYNRINAEGISFATVALPKFFNCFSSFIESGVPSFPGFKKNKPRSPLPAFLNRLTGMVYAMDAHDADCAHAFRVIYMLCSAFKKLKGPYSESVLSEQLDKFIADDESLMSLDYSTDDYCGDVLRRARELVNTLFLKVDLGSLMPKPGSGATNTPRKYHERFEPHVVYRQLAEAFPYGSWFYHNSYAFAAEMFNGYLDLQEEDIPTSRMKFIHKYVGKPRGICIEENETQYCQQAIKGLMYKVIQTHPMTRGRVNFDSQDINRELALMSSDDKSFCTIDMSEASNMIWRVLVFQLFRDTPLLPFLDAVSTRVITFPEDVRKGSMYTQKFAPMGSAVCFPIMATVHYVLCRAIMEASQLGNAREQSKRVYVYGDDILLPVEFTEEIFTNLPKFGMRLNKEKSFYKSSFRESCGLHAYGGHEVTPVYNNYTLNVKHERSDSTRLLSCISKEALYHECGYAATAETIRRHIRKVYGQIPFGDPSSGFLCFKRKSEYNVLWQSAMARKTRYCFYLHSHQYLMRCVVPRYNDHTVKEGSDLLRWYLTHPEEGAETFMEFDKLKIAYRWVNESDLG